MSSFLTHMTWWHWMLFAVALAAAETLLPGAVAIWFAAAAALAATLASRFAIRPGVLRFERAAHVLAR